MTPAARWSPEQTQAQANTRLVPADLAALRARGLHESRARFLTRRWLLAGSGWDETSITRRRFIVALLAIGFLALTVRAVYPTADPPSQPPAGITWHDEGAWVHNARNRALFGAWRLDEWNPVFIAPVFSGLEYVSFRTFGVGLWQARAVSVAAGILAVLLLALGVSRLAGRLAGLIAGAFLATNYVYVMFDRAALMEATMVAFIVASWYCYVRAQESPRWGLAAGFCAVLAYFSKASAAFFLAALGIEALIALAGRPEALVADSTKTDHLAGLARRRRAAWFTLAGLVGAGAAALAVFVAPYWTEYRFYNWQVSVSRKPSYSIKAMLDRASWFPIIHDTFTRMWLVTLLALGAGLSALARWRALAAAERLLLLWVGLGAAELVIHDVGNERRLVFLIPALVALAALTLGRDRRLLTPEVAETSLGQALLAAPILLFALYLAAGALVRLAFLYQVRPGVRSAAAIALLSGALVYLTWPRVPRWLSREGWSAGASLILAALVVGGNLAQFVQWSAGRSYKNYEASVAIGRWLPRGTLVHGKLANGLSLENEIRPIFVGREFGNYTDRRSRDDVRYLLTYVAPRIGYEGPVILDVLDAYPRWRIVRSFDVSETPGGHDRAALIDKRPE